MPDTYTKEQINGAKEYLKEAAETNSGFTNSCIRTKPLIIILSALSTAEHEIDRWHNLHAIVLDNAAMWAKSAEKAESERDALAARCAELEARMQGAGWISARKQLPKSNCRTICYCFGSVFMAMYDKKAKHWWGDQSGVDVTHWMPMPPPPNEKED